MGGRWVLCLGLLSLAWGITTATQATERIAQSLEIKLYPMSESEWSTAKSSAFTTAVSAAATTYCTANLNTCGLDSAATFTSTEVGISSTEDQSKSMLLTFYIDFPATATVSASSSLQFVLASAVLETVTRNARDTIRSDTDTYVTYIGDTYLGIPVDETSNAIIIPIAVLIVLVVAVVTVCLVRWQTKKERAERLQKRAEKKSYGTNNSLPNYNILETTNTTYVSGATTTPRYGNGNRVGPDDYSKWSPEKQQTSKTQVMITSPRRPPKVTEFREEEPEASGRNGLAPIYPPLPADNGQLLEGEAERQERKRRRKERKREKRRLKDEMEMYDNQGMDTSGLTDTDTSVPTFTVQRGNAVA